MALVKLFVKHVQNNWDRGGVNPIVTDWSDAILSRLNAVNGDEILVVFHAVENPTGTETDMVLTGAMALHCVIRATNSPTSVMYGFQDSYNQGDYPAGEDLAAGKVTWKMSVGYIKYPITGVTQVSKIFKIDHNMVVQFADGDVLTVTGSTGNDGSYTVDGTPTYDVGTDKTIIVVHEAIPNATVDGDIIHSALQHISITAGYLDACVGISWVDPAADPQTLMPAFRFRVHQQLDDGGVNATAGTGPIYVTMADVLSAIAVKEDTFAPITLTASGSISPVSGRQWVYCDTITAAGSITVAVPDATLEAKCEFIVVNVGDVDPVVLHANIPGQTFNGIVGDQNITNQFSAAHLKSYDGNWIVPNFVIPS